MHACNIPLKLFQETHLDPVLGVLALLFTIMSLQRRRQIILIFARLDQMNDNDEEFARRRKKEEEGFR